MGVMPYWKYVPDLRSLSSSLVVRRVLYCRKQGSIGLVI